MTQLKLKNLQLGKHIGGVAEDDYIGSGKIKDESLPPRFIVLPSNSILIHTVLCSISMFIRCPDNPAVTPRPTLQVNILNWLLFVILKQVNKPHTFHFIKYPMWWNFLLLDQM